MVNVNNGGCNPDSGGESSVAGAENRPISTIVIVIAMQTEAMPLVNRLKLAEDLDSAFTKGTPWVRYHGTYKDLHINIVLPGKDYILGVDRVGTVTVSLVTLAAIQTFQPDVLINVGSAGGLKAKNACIGDVFLASVLAFHDRRIPIPVCDRYGVGSRKALSTPNLLKELALKVGILSTGNSLEMSPRDKALIIENDATLKDMEGAAICYVAHLLKVPAIFIKAVTNIVDFEKPSAEEFEEFSPNMDIVDFDKPTAEEFLPNMDKMDLDKPTAEEFLPNLEAVIIALEQAVTRVIDFINGKCLSEL